MTLCKRPAIYEMWDKRSETQTLIFVYNPKLVKSLNSVLKQTSYTEWSVNLRN